MVMRPKNNLLNAEFIIDAILNPKSDSPKAHNSSEAINHEVSRVIAQSLATANITSLDEVESVELIGGGWRVPLIQSSLEVRQTTTIHLITLISLHVFYSLHLATLPKKCLYFC